MLKVKLSSFEGPLDLLLHLIEKAEVDIYQISVAEIADQYVEYIRQAEREQFDIASEYLVMAATLLAIKSKMLLPRTEEKQDEGLVSENLEEDWQHVFIEKLIEYRKFKQVVSFLRQEEAKRSLIFTRPAGDLSVYLNPSSLPVASVSLFDLVQALRHVLNQKKSPPVNTVEGEAVSLEQRMEEIRQEIVEKKRLAFSRLFSVNRNRSYIIITFLAILELMKNREIYCVQNHIFGEIMIFAMETGGHGSEGA